MLRTRLGRRFVLLFVLCALVPVIAFGVLADRAVSRELQAQAQARVKRAAKDASVSLLQQLEQIESDARRAVERNEVATLPAHDPRIVRTATISATELPVDVRTRLAEGRAALRLRTTSGAPVVQQLLPPPTAGRDTLLAVDIDPTRLLAGISGTDLVPPASRVCLQMATTALGCVAAPDAAAGDERAAHGSAAVFLRYAFGAPDILVDVAESEVVGLAPLHRFRDLFIPVALAAVVLAALLAQVTIRRQTAPLAALQAGTRRIADGDFAHRVPVTTRDELGDLAHAFNAMTHQLDRQFHTLELRHDVDVAVLAATSHAALIEVLLERIGEVVNCEHAIILVPVTETGIVRLDRWRVHGARRVGDPVDVRLPADEVQRLQAAGNDGWMLPMGGRPSYLAALGGTDACVLPIRSGGTLSGLLALGLERADVFTADDRRRAEQLAAQVAVAFANLRLLDELRALNAGALEALARTTDAASPWTAGHSTRVTEIAVALAEADGLDAETVDLVRRGALLHDIGKLAVPVAILDKPGPLTDEERAIMAQHPVVGARILQPIAAFAPLLPMVRHHHERWDGTGYPDRLRGEGIHPLARLLAVADVAESMLAARPYRAPLSVEFVTGFIRDNAGRHFDPHYASLFTTAVEQRDPRLMAALAPYSAPPAAAGVTAAPTSLADDRGDRPEASATDSQPRQLQEVA